MTRKTFIIDDCEVTAGGVLFYKKNKLLMIRCNGKLEDFGGKADPNDSNIYETISREVEEESNNIFKKEDLYKKIIKKKVYISVKSKYLFIFVKVNKNYNVGDFGNREIYENIPRTVEWVHMDKFKNKDFVSENLAWRLRTKDFFQTIFGLKNKNITTLKKSE
ncbi:MAG: hypothetical protein CMF62_03850 [Magnetococcales bacterium]|nr:hypothetical protein [Magnetococcales bacterium]|tara:strand:+ start:29755 stop:30243 length:489 start_codon:yes stop_codon:yes gene_type:complete